MLNNPLDDEADDAESYQKWMGTQAFAQSQAAAPTAAQQPQVPTVQTAPAVPGAGRSSFPMPAPPPPPPPIPGLAPPVGAGQRPVSQPSAWDLTPPTSMPTPVAPTIVPPPQAETPAPPPAPPPVPTPKVAPVPATPGAETAPAKTAAPKVDTYAAAEDDGLEEWLSPKKQAKQAQAAGANAKAGKPGQQPAGGMTTAEQFNQEFATWAKQQMAGPSRYSSKLVEEGQAVINASIARDKGVAQQALAEHMAERGLVQGSTEYDTQFMEMETRFAEQAQALKFELGREQAMTWAQDLNIAGQMGAVAGGLLNDREAMLLMDERNRISLRLQARGMDQVAADRAADRQMQKDIADANRDWEREKWREYTELEYGGAEEETEPGPDPNLGTPGPEYATGNPQLEKDIWAYTSGANHNSTTWDAFAAKYGVEAAKSYLGPRP